MTEIRKGKMIILDGQPFQVQKADYLRMQQRRPVMRTILKNITTGATREHSFQQSDKVEEANVARVPYQFLYVDADTYAFMDQETFEQIELDKNAVGDAAQFLLEGQVVDMVMFDGDDMDNGMGGGDSSMPTMPPAEGGDMGGSDSDGGMSDGGMGDESTGGGM